MAVMDHFDAVLASYGLRLEPMLATLVVLAIGSVVVVMLNRALRRWLTGIEARLPLPLDTVLLISRGLGALLWLCIALVILSTWGVGVTGMWAFLVSAATAIGVGFLATWTMVSNLTANVFLAIWHPFRLGQNVELLPEGMKGRVIERNMMFTVLREKEGPALYVPNNLFFQKVFRVDQTDEQYLFEFLEHSHEKEPGRVAPAREPEKTV
jgi:small-conductance mechanosensitive channel